MSTPRRIAEKNEVAEQINYTQQTSEQHARPRKGKDPRRRDFEDLVFI